MTIGIEKNTLLCILLRFPLEQRVENCLEIFITKKCDSNLAEFKSLGRLENQIHIGTALSIIDQLLDAHEQLKKANVSHNDIKPNNILIDEDIIAEIKVYVGDFGQADKMGGTPGWTPPEFIGKRIPGVSDMYSFGLLILF